MVASDYYAVQVRGENAGPRLVRCDIQMGFERAMLVHHGFAELIECKLHASGGALQCTSGWIHMEKCSVYDSTCSAGVCVKHQGQAVLKDCELTTSGLAGLEVTTGSAVTMEGCEIHHNFKSGLAVGLEGDQGYKGSKATATITCTDCDIHDNKYTNVFSGEHGVSTLKRCKIRNAVAAVLSAEYGEQLAGASVGCGIALYKGGLCLYDQCGISNNPTADVMQVG